MPLMSQDKNYKLIENEILAYKDSSNINNETFTVFSQSDHEDDDQTLVKKSNKNTSGFNHIQTKVNLSSNAKKFKETIITPPLSIAEDNLQKQMVAELDSEG